MEKDTSVIPKGNYCYYGIKGKTCPYWKMVGVKCGYCAYDDMSDEDYHQGGYFSLLWDQVKECDINTEDDNED